MRQIFLDTETTGLFPAQGHRIIEIAAIEVINRRVTKNHFHVYVNPEREIDQGAQEVHGITLEFLQDKPAFAEIVDEFLDFINGAEVVIHNAPFDIGFLNTELGRIDRLNVEHTCAGIIDTLKMAKDMRPGQRNSLDALCRHFGIDNSKRTLHGALLDAELLAEVYMAMTRGQESLMMDMEITKPSSEVAVVRDQPLLIIRAETDELLAHEAYLDEISKSASCVWNRALDSTETEGN